MRFTKIKMGLMCLGLLSAASASANFADFDITIQFGDGLSASQQSVFSAAEAFWEERIVGYAPEYAGPTGLLVTAQGVEIDGVGQILGQAGPTVGFNNSANGILYATEGVMSFDTADLGAMEAQGSLFYVIRHELAHVIGFGTLWELNNLYDPGSGQYTGAFANQAYINEFDLNASFVPVELDGGPGTADGHWDETWAGPTNEIMTGYFEGTISTSATTLASFRDLGYVTSNMIDAFAPATAFISIGMLGLLGVRRKEV